MLHRPLIALRGLLLGECWKLDELAAACATDGTYEFLLTANSRKGSSTSPTMTLTPGTSDVRSL